LRVIKKRRRFREELRASNVEQNGENNLTDLIFAY